MLAILRNVAKQYSVLVIFAIAIGLAFPGPTSLLAPYTTWFLAVIFFLSALHIDLRQVRDVAKDFKLVLLVNLFMLIVFPLVVFAIALLVIPRLSIALLLLAAMPAGMTSPLLTKLLHGKEDLALVLTVSTSLLAPLTIPFIISSLVGTAVDISFFEMFSLLAYVIFVPFALAQVVRKFKISFFEKSLSLQQSVSTILLVLLVAGIVAKQADRILVGFNTGESWHYLFVLFIFFGLFHIAGYLTAFKKNHGDRLAIMICLAYMNFVLAIALADKFFGTPNIVIPVVLSVLPWSLMFPLLQVFNSYRQGHK